MTISTQPLWLLHALRALHARCLAYARWCAYPQLLYACLRRLACSLLLWPPPASPSAFKPYLRPVSRRAMPQGASHWRSKPDWVRSAIFDLAMALPGAGYRTIAHCFNLQQQALHQTQSGHVLAVGGYADSLPATVSKTFFAQLLTRQRSALAQARLRARSHAARREPVLTTWGMGLTGLPLTDGSSVPVFGIIDHGSRALPELQPVATYNSLILLGKLLMTMGMHGKPRAVRNDNEAVFKTVLFKVVLRLIGVRQQFTDVGSPWQNGRIERFWRTLKTELQTKAVWSRRNGIAVQTRMKFASINAMQALLEVFTFSYNAYWPHQCLGGATPAMVWNGQVEAARRKRKAKPSAPTKTHARKARAPPA
jgi:putative transposase